MVLGLHNWMLIRENVLRMAILVYFFFYFTSTMLETNWIPIVTRFCFCRRMRKHQCVNCDHCIQRCRLQGSANVDGYHGWIYLTEQNGTYISINPVERRRTAWGTEVKCLGYSSSNWILPWADLSPKKGLNHLAYVVKVEYWSIHLLCCVCTIELSLTLTMATTCFYFSLIVDLDTVPP